MDKFEKFKQKEKFIEEKVGYANYPGIADLKMRPIFSQKINAVADDFKIISQMENPKDQDYQNQIRKGLDNFADVYLILDTEDRERVCSYFEELMDIVGLENSDGQLNNFMYGFDPNSVGKH